MIIICSECSCEFKTKDKRRVTCSQACAYKRHSKWVKEHQTGQNNPFFGKQHTETAKNKMSVSKKKLVENGWKPANYGIRKEDKVPVLCKDSSWRTVRKFVLIRDSYKCQMPDCANKAASVHHIVLRRVVNEHKPEKLISLCRKHHDALNKKEHLYEDLFLGIVSKYYANGESPEQDNPVAQPQLEEGARD